MPVCAAAASRDASVYPMQSSRAIRAPWRASRPAATVTAAAALRVEQRPPVVQSREGPGADEQVDLGSSLLERGDGLLQPGHDALAVEHDRLAITKTAGHRVLVGTRGEGGDRR
jgi:hypothetical protein